ncbi:MAG: helix-turn-helix domain-containing protein [bacterium]|nr:helix-turn-helix domain-containing protein [bacterium]
MVQESSSFMTVNEVAGYLRLHEMSIYRMCQNGTIPSFKIGKSWRFKRERLEEWLTGKENTKEEELLCGEKIE